ncbi:hypothetical protein [Kocuria rhizophila]|uniref:HNH endonuclease n=1 Tax=Kocuria rhizophila TaxID=72000 RepID=UPI003D6FA3F6
MPWLRVGDSAATNPIVAEVREHPDADDRTKLEVFGFVTLCATVGAQHLTDYVVSRATAADVAGSMERADRLLEQATFAGYLEPVTEIVRGQERARWRIVEDPEFIHMRTQEEVEWERRRKRDNSNPALTIPVRLRDGDACRYCGQVVRFRARTGRLAGTYDHRNPGRGAETPDDLVVACTRCNSGRKNNPHAERDYPLLPVPEKPYYSLDTVEFIKNSDWARSNGIEPPPAPKAKVQPGHVPPGHTAPEAGTPAAGEERAPQGSSDSPARQPDTAAPTPVAEARPGTPGDRPPRSSAETSRSRQESAGSLPTDPDGPGRAGSGRVGTGGNGNPARPPQKPDTPDQHDHPPKKRASRSRRRGRRGKK